MNRKDIYKILDTFKTGFIVIDEAYIDFGGESMVPYIEKYDNLWLDTAMAVTDYLPLEKPVNLHELRTDRILYGSDFPNIPYAWDREIKELGTHFQDRQQREQVLGKNAIGLFAI